MGGHQSCTGPVALGLGAAYWHPSLGAQNSSWAPTLRTLLPALPPHKPLLHQPSSAGVGPAALEPTWEGGTQHPGISTTR